MKKQVFVTLAALFALFMGAYAADTSTDTETAALNAADNVYAILYDDGTLVFQYGNTPEPGRTVKEAYPVDLTVHYSYDRDTWTANTPWYNERKSVYVVNFKDKISPMATAQWFHDCTHLESVANIQNLDTTNVTSMADMFYGCSGLTALDVSHFDTKNVTDMNGMFYGCSGLTALDVSHFDTSHVTNMRHMFCGCSGLTALDLSHFNTANVKDMTCMFAQCGNLTSLDVSHWNTTNVTDMCSMFSLCNVLTALDVSHFDTTNVTDMRWMFYACRKLTALDVSHFDTSHVTNMRYMFYRCNGLTALDVSHFDTSHVTDMSYMFFDCNNLTALDVSHFDTSHVTNMCEMFDGCNNLTALDMSHFDTSHVTDMFAMFSTCNGLTALDVSNFDTANVTDMGWMFSYCSNLKTIYTSNKFTTASVEEGPYTGGSKEMFSDCTSLVGGNGTKYDKSHTDKEYARIDTASAPGYFTDKNATPAPVPYEITALIPKPDTGILLVKLTNPAPATVFVAYFDTKKQFLTTDMKTVPANAESVELKLLNVNRARVSMFDDQYRPLCSPYVSIVGA